MKLQGQVAVVTGASRGIGKEIALAYAREGAKVVIHYHKNEQSAFQIQKAIEERGGTAFIYQADVRNVEEIDRMIKEVIGQFGRIDILVNNAGIAEYKMFIDLREQEWKNMMDIHVNGAFHCSQKVLRYMLRENNGTIINISSVWGMVGASCEVHYSTAKGALIAFTKALAKEVGPSGITVNCIAPGVIETDMLKELEEEDKEALKEETPIGRLGTPSDVAYVAVFLAQKEARFITGQVISPNGGFVI